MNIYYILFIIWRFVVIQQVGPKKILNCHLHYQITTKGFVFLCTMKPHHHAKYASNLIRPISCCSCDDFITFFDTSYGIKKLKSYQFYKYSIRDLSTIKVIIISRYKVITELTWKLQFLTNTTCKYLLKLIFV